MRGIVRFGVLTALALVGGAAAAGGCVGSAEEGEVVCPTYELACDGACFDPLRDPRHCGGCGNRCGPREVCDWGVCALRCPTGLTACGGECRDVASDAANCGACGVVCGDGGYCIEGECLGDCIGCVGDLPDSSGGRGPQGERFPGGGSPPPERDGPIPRP